MEDLARLENALVKAHEAGDRESAAILAKEISSFKQGPQEVSTARQLEAGVQGAANLLTADHADRILAGIGTGGGYLGDYDKTLKSIRERMDETSRLAPGSELLGGVAAGFVPVAGQVGRVASVAKGGSKLLGIGKLAAKGAGAGAAYEGLATHGRDRGDTTPDDYVDNMLQGGLVGGVAGPVGAGILAGGRWLAKGKSKTSTYEDRRDKAIKESKRLDEKVHSYDDAIPNSSLSSAVKKGKEELKTAKLSGAPQSAALVRDLEKALKRTSTTKVPPKTTKEYSGMDDDGYSIYETKTTREKTKGPKESLTLDKSANLYAKINKAMREAEGKDLQIIKEIKKAFKSSLELSLGEEGAKKPKQWKSFWKRNSAHRAVKTEERLRKVLNQDSPKISELRDLARDESLPRNVRKLLSEAAKDPPKWKQVVRTLSNLPFGISGGLIDLASGRGLQGFSRLGFALGARGINSSQRGKLERSVQDALFGRKRVFGETGKKEALAPMNKGLLSTGLGASGAGLFSDGEY